MVRATPVLRALDALRFGAAPVAWHRKDFERIGKLILVASVTNAAAWLCGLPRYTDG